MRYLRQDLGVVELPTLVRPTGRMGWARPGLRAGPRVPDEAVGCQTVTMADELVELTVVDAVAWRVWLESHDGGKSAGVWLVLAKKATMEPTSLTHDQALDEALCCGWIDGQLRKRDETTYCQRFTPRQARSSWSKRNVTIVERLIDEGRMHAAGLAEVERAKADGRWDAAYSGMHNMSVPGDFAEALAAEPRAQAMFETLSGQNRYSVLYRIENAKRADTRSKRIERFVAMLAREETIYPQRDSRSG